MKLVIALAVTATGLGGALAATVGAQPSREPGSTAVMRSAGGTIVGRVTLAPRRSGAVTVRATIRGLEPGFHGFHVHAVGTCDRTTRGPTGAPEPFRTAGPHYNPRGVPHGLHPADFPPLLAARGGVAITSFVTDRFRLRELLDRDGSAVMVHATSDNQGNIPGRYQGPEGSGPDAETRATGDTGPRMACGVVRPARGR